MITRIMYTLAVDASTEILSAALCDDSGARAEISFDAQRTHAERILETIDAVLTQAGVSLHEVDLLGVSQGPGSFTGIRIAVATMKGLALGIGKPLVGVSTLRAMAWLGDGVAATVCPLIDARMNEVYGAIYRRARDGWTADAPDRVGPIEGILAVAPSDCVVLGDGATRYADRLRAAAPHLRVLPPEAGRPSAAAVAREARAAHRAGNSGDPAAVCPVYLRQSQPEEVRRHAQAKTPA